MKKNILVSVVFLSFVFLVVQVLAEVNVTDDNLSIGTNMTNDTIVLPDNSTNISVVANNTSNATILIRNFFPKTANVGDVQLNINVQNIGLQELINVGAFVSGDGFSSYEVVPIDSWGVQEKSYILVSGNFRKAGSINLTIRINQDVFYEVVNVTDSVASALEQANQQLAADITSSLSSLKQNYTLLENAIQLKKDEGYDVSGVSVNDLKTMIRDAQSNLLSGNLAQAKVKIDLALEEYITQESKLSGVKKVSLSQKLKDNAVLFSTLAGAIITFFTLYELLKRKNEHLREKIKSIRVKDKNGNVVSVNTK